MRDDNISRRVPAQAGRFAFAPSLAGVVGLILLIAFFFCAAQVPTLADHDSGTALSESAAASVLARAVALAPLDADIPESGFESPFPAVRSARGEKRDHPPAVLASFSFKRNSADDGEYAFARLLARTLSPLCRIACG